MPILNELQHAALKGRWHDDAQLLQKQSLAAAEVPLVLPVPLDMKRQVGLSWPAIGTVLNQQTALAVVGLGLAQVLELL